MCLKIRDYKHMNERHASSIERSTYIQKQSPKGVLLKKVFLKYVLFIKKRLQRRCFSVNIAKFSRTSFFYRTPPVATSDQYTSPSVLVEYRKDARKN